MYVMQVLALALLASCAVSPPVSGSAQFAVSIPQALSSSGVTRVLVTVSASGMEALSVELAKSNGSWGGLIGNIPAGSNRSFNAQAFDASGTLRFQGQTSGVTLSPNQTTAVALTLQEVSAPPPYGNEAPLIDSLVASPTSVLTGGAVSLLASVHDPNPGDTLTLAWTGSSGSFSERSAASTAWTAPASAGIHTLTLTVTDSQGAAVSVSLAINVIAGAPTGNAALDISFNHWPVVSKVVASLSRLDAGQSTSVSATAADADGDGLSYQWASSCQGTWTQASSSTASFVPSSVPASACNNCQLTVTVRDSRGGQTTGSLALCVAASSTERFPPRITNLYQSASSTAPGQTVTFEVTALDPQSSTLTFAWSAPGALGTPVNGASTSRVTWTAPACVSGGTPAVITATVTNAFNLSATQGFPVAGLPTCIPAWAATGSLISSRYHHTATVLPNGKVLVTGGVQVYPYASAEVYDPASGTWSTTGTMAQPRYLHTATLLPNGKVLVTGGLGSTSVTEVYDPASGTWSTAGAMATPRGEHTATLLPNGKVLVAGGFNGGVSLATAEVYDPASGIWSAAGAMASPRSRHTAVLLPNGKVLVAGGINGSVLAAAEVYDPASNTWSATGSLVLSRIYHTAALLPDGKVLVAGGYNADGHHKPAEVYDSTSGTWSLTGAMAQSRYLHTATRLQNGKVLIVGGGSSSGGDHSTAEVYDPAAGTWSATASMASLRRSHAAALLPNGKVLIPGGYRINGGIPASELYSP
jgi:N-acetylneuraminic acid mutarotase